MREEAAPLSPAVAEMLANNGELDQLEFGGGGAMMLPTAPQQPQQPMRLPFPPPDWEAEQAERAEAERREREAAEALARERQLQAEIEAADQPESRPAAKRRWRP